MAFAQLIWCESLRDIEAGLSAQSAKLYRMEFREPVRRSTLADATDARLTNLRRVRTAPDRTGRIRMRAASIRLRWIAAPG